MENEEKTPVSNEEIMAELKKQRKIITAILILVCVIAAAVIVYIIFKMTVGSIFTQVVNLITGLF
ncbi:MAG: hypothetical protein ACI4J1_03595 [Ruminiclostridium sp.]